MAELTSAALHPPAAPLREAWTLNQRWCADLVATLAGCGVEEAVLCPGSRSAPLALAFAEHPALRSHVVTDERSAGFLALGLAKASGRPVAVLCTSGTAGAHLLPAVMEAAQGGTPLVAVTADRPWELQGFGAAQTADQTGLFAGFLRARELLPAPEDRPGAFAHLVAACARAMHLGSGSPRGPVHLNVPLREPLEPATLAAGPVGHPLVPRFHRSRQTARLQEVRAALAACHRPLIVVGPCEPGAGAGAAALQALAERLGAPLLAEAASNHRFGSPAAIGAYDAMLRAPRFADASRPDLVLRFGGVSTSKILSGWLDACAARTFVFPGGAPLVDPTHRAEAIIDGDLESVCGGLAECRTGDGAWRRTWLAAQARVEAVLAEGVADVGEPLAARGLVAALPVDGCLVVSSSMPIRDLDAFASRPGATLRVFANRGLNGIDGILSTAVGVAAASRRPTAVLLGDLALLHDLTGLLLARHLGVPLTVVVVNNDGGGIFGFLPIAGRTRRFEALFGAPHGVDLSHAAALAGARLHRPTGAAAYRAALSEALAGGLHLIEVRTDRTANVAHHRALADRLADAVERLA